MFSAVHIGMRQAGMTALFPNRDSDSDRDTALWGEKQTGLSLCSATMSACAVVLHGAVAGASSHS